MEYFCAKCDYSHTRPIGRWCTRVSMATNISTTQAITAVSAVRPTCNADTLTSPIASRQPNQSPTSVDLATNSTATTLAPSGLSTRAEELILRELKKLSARMTHMEQEMQSDTFTSTPRRRKKPRANRTREELTAGANNMTINQTMLDESAISNQQNSRIVIPIHTQLAASTTTTSTTSLFSQRTTLGGTGSRSPTDRG